MPSPSQIAKLQVSPAEDPTGAALVKELGSGPVAVALGLTTPCVCNWRRRGVPRAYRFLVAQLAEQKGLAVPKGFLPMLAQPGELDAMS